MTPDEIRAWAARAEKLRNGGIMVGPGEPTDIIVEALRMLAEARKAVQSRGSEAR